MNIRSAATPKPSPPSHRSHHPGGTAEAKRENSQVGSLKQTLESLPELNLGGDSGSVVPASPTHRFGSEGAAPGGPGLTGFLGGLGEFKAPVPLAYGELQETTAANRRKEAETISPEIDPNAEVAVIDSFAPFDGPSHGELVSQVLQATSPDADIQRFENTSHYGAPVGLLTAPGAASPSERLDSFLEHNTTGFLERTNAHLENIVSDPESRIRTINQSEGLNIGTELGQLVQVATHSREDGSAGLTPAGEVAFEALGIEPNPTPENLRLFSERAVARIESVHQSSPSIQTERQRHVDVSRRLAEQGVSYVVSAGNQGQLLEAYRQRGVNIPDSFDDNLLSNPYNVVVGASNSGGTEDPRDDSMATFSSADPEVDFVASGVDVSADPATGISHSGTSFSAPLVAGRLDALRAANPNLPGADLLKLLSQEHGQRSYFTDVPMIR